jgi:hypothetical protein
MRMFGQLRTALLARKVPTAGLAAIYRYRDAGDIRRDLEGLHAAGLIDTTGDGAIQATESGRAVLTEMYKVSADIAGELWAGQEGSLAGLSNLAGRVVDAALVTGGDAYLAMAPPYEPADAAPGLRLHTRLSVLRYHRADAHAAAWQDTHKDLHVAAVINHARRAARQPVVFRDRGGLPSPAGVGARVRAAEPAGWNAPAPTAQH